MTFSSCTFCVFRRKAEFPSNATHATYAANAKSTQQIETRALCQLHLLHSLHYVRCIAYVQSVCIKRNARSAFFTQKNENTKARNWSGCLCFCVARAVLGKNRVSLSTKKNVEKAEKLAPSRAFFTWKIWASQHSSKWSRFSTIGRSSGGVRMRSGDHLKWRHVRLRHRVTSDKRAQRQQQLKSARCRCC